MVAWHSLDRNLNGHDVRVAPSKEKERFLGGARLHVRMCCLYSSVFVGDFDNVSYHTCCRFF